MRLKITYKLQVAGALLLLLGTLFVIGYSLYIDIHPGVILTKLQFVGPILIITGLATGTMFSLVEGILSRKERGAVNKTNDSRNKIQK